MLTKSVDGVERQVALYLFGEDGDGIERLGLVTGNAVVAERDCNTCG